MTCSCRNPAWALALLTMLTMLNVVGAVEPAFAEPPAEPPADSDAARIDPASLLAANLVVANPQAFARDELADLHAGAMAVPDFIREVVGQVTVRRVPRPCLFGMGRYSEACPTWSDDGVFLLYDVPPLQGEGPVWRLQPLTRPERIAVQRRRAIVHAFMSKWDNEIDWSSERAWRAINGWTLKTDPQNVYRWGYSRFMGKRSPHLDLVTFAEEFFVRPEAVVASERRAELDPNTLVGCQEFTKSRFLREHLTRRDPSWLAPKTWFATCPEFERWARTDAVDGIDVLIAAATADRPESLYGHLLLHVRYRGASDGFEPVYQFGAVTDTDVGFIEYFSRGLLGGFLSAIEVADFRAVDRRILQVEQRSLRHYRLNLDRRQIRHLQERLWEAERRVRYPYFFLDDNCASFLYDLIEPALGIRLPGRGSFIVTPTDVLDTLATTSNGDRGPLLSKSTEVHFSSRARAQDAVGKRREALARIVDATGSERLEKLGAELEEAGVSRRTELYAALGESMNEAIATEPARGLHRAALDYFLYSSRVERFVVEVEQSAFRAARMSTLELPSRTADAQLAQREALFLFEDLQRRAEIVTRLSREADERLAQQPESEWSDAARARKVRLDRARGAYRAALEGLSSVIDRWEPDLDAVAYLDATEAEFRREEAARDARAVGPSGKHRVVVGAGGLARANEVAPNLQLNYAFIAEYLGEQRRRGLRPDIESQVFDLELSVPMSNDFVGRIDADLTLFGFKTIEQPLDPVRRSWDDAFGWGFDGVIRHDGARRVWTELALGGGYLWPALKRDYGSTHLVFGAYPEARAVFVPAGTQGQTAARLFALARVHTGGSYANAVTFRASTGHAFQFPLWGWAWRADARLAWDIGAGGGDDPWVLRPFVEGEATNETYRLGAEGETFWRARGGLEVEL